jgi:putative phosphoribosyl transferase
LIAIPINNNDSPLEGDLIIPDVCEIMGIIIFAHGSGSDKDSPRNQYVGKLLNKVGFATLLINLLILEEQDADRKAQTLSRKIPGIVLNKFNISLLADRLVTITEWIKTYEVTRHFKVGYFGASTGAVAAIEAAVLLDIHNHIIAIVSRGGRPDLATINSLRNISGAILLIVGDKDSKAVIDLNKKALKELRNAKEKKLVMIPGAGHLFEETGAIDGQELVELMIDHNIGVSVVRSVEMKKIDSDYFEETV